MHCQLALVAHGIGFRRLALAALLVLDPQKRSRSDNIAPFIRRQELQRRPRIGALLYLIKKEQCPPGNELHIRKKSRNARKNGTCVKRLVKNRDELLMLDKIDLNEVLVTLSPELPDNVGLADLPRTLYQQTLLLRLGLPSPQDIIDFSPQLDHNPPPS